MENYSVLLLILLTINLVYTWKHDTTMFLFILLLIVGYLYLEDLYYSEISKLKNDLDKYIGSLKNNIESGIKDTIKNNVKPNIPPSIYNKLSKA